MTRVRRPTGSCRLRSHTPAPPPAEDGQLPLAVSIPEAAKLLGISKSLAYELAARGELDTIRLGRRIVVPRNVISKMLQLG